MAGRVSGPHRSAGLTLHRVTRDWVALVLAIGLVLVLNLIIAGVLIVAVFQRDRPLEDGTQQFLVAAFGGVCGVLGSYIGFRAGHRDRHLDDEHHSIDEGTTS